MKNIIEALLIVWPRGIPASEYERALTLAGKFGALAPSLMRAETKPAAAPTTSPSKKRPAATMRVGKPGLEKIRAALSTGPATAAEIVGVTGLSGPTVWCGLQVVGRVVEKRHRVGSTGSPTFVYALKEAP